MFAFHRARPVPCLLAALVALPALAGTQTGPRGGHEHEDHRHMRNPYAWPPLEELAALADTIVTGEVIEMTSAWNAAHSEIFTTVVLRTERRLHGLAGGQVRFRVPGGQVGDMRVIATHMPVFTMGERALVFLRNSGPRLPRVVAGEAGKRSLIEGDDGALHPVPGFDSADGGEPGRPGATLDELAAALPAILAAASR